MVNKHFGMRDFGAVRDERVSAWEMLGAGLAYVGAVAVIIALAIVL